MDENNNPLVIRASDSDKEANSLLVYKILEPEALKFLKIDPSMGTLTTVLELDYESMPSFQFNVFVHDQGSPVLFAPTAAQVIINVRNINDCPPRFSDQIYEVAVLKPIHQGMELLMVQAVTMTQKSTIASKLAMLMKLLPSIPLLVVYLC